MEDQFIDDVLCTALDPDFGGSRCWIKQTFIFDGTKADFDVIREYEAVSKGATLAIEMYNSDKSFTFTRDDFESAVAEYAVRQETTVEELDVADISAGNADEILQLALFGEVVYF